MPPRSSGRTELIADTALALLAERGMRGLTHRAVDEAAGLPLGTTSNYARTRAALLETAVVRLADLEGRLAEERRAAAASRDGRELADALAGILHRFLTVRRPYTIARFELALEATRRPELRAVYDAAARGFLEPMAAALACAGSPDPRRHAESLLSWMEGVAFVWVAGPSAGCAPPAPEALRQGVGELLEGMGVRARPSDGTLPRAGAAR